jgi:antitoxin component YwqK of YwqJK toxin-antitoxin module
MVKSGRRGLAPPASRGYARLMRIVLGLSLTLALSGGCATTNGPKEAQNAGDAQSGQPGAGAKDKSRCDPSGKKVTTVDLNGDKKPDVWKFYATVVENGANLDVLTCKEVDLNFDEKKDMWVYYDNAGNINNEEYDLDFDGKIDLWVYRQNGHIVREEFDSNFDSRPDIWKFYENDKLVRLERSSKKNGKVDVWEYYEGGKLDRIGYDSTGSGQIDRWDRAPEEQQAQAAAGGAPAGTATPAANTRPVAPTAAPETAGTATTPAPKN